MIVFGVWVHDYERDELLGLYRRREDAEAEAAKHDPAPPGIQWPDSRGMAVVEQHTIH